MGTNSAIKGLNTILSNKTKAASQLKIEIAELQKKLSTLSKEISEIQTKKDAAANDGEIKVSEHAIIRYLERVKGIDITKLEKEILTKQVIDCIKTLGNGTYPNSNFRVLVKDNMVITVLTY